MEAPLRKVEPERLKCHYSEGKTIRLPGGSYWVRGSFGMLAEPGGCSCVVVTGELSFLTSWVVLLWGRLRGVPVYLWTHGMYKVEKGWAKWIRIVYFRLPAGLLLYHDLARHTMEKLGFRSHRLHVIYNAVDDDDPIPEGSLTMAVRNEFEANFNAVRPVVLFTGRLLQEKQLDLLLRASHIAGSSPVLTGFNLVLVGDGAELKTLQDLSRSLGLEKSVWFHGACYDPERLAQLFEWADAVASPGNIGLTAIHALRHGTPVITHDNPRHQMPEAEAIRDGENGAFFAEGDPADLAKTLSDWFHRHPQKTDTLRARCNSIVKERCNSRSQADRILQALGQVPSNAE